MKAQQVIQDQYTPTEVTQQTDYTQFSKPQDEKKGRFSKAIILGMLLFLLLFVFLVLYLFKQTGNEPSTLISCVFAFCGVEGGALAWIKTIKSKNGGEN